MRKICLAFVFVNGEKKLYWTEDFAIDDMFVDFYDVHKKCEVYVTRNNVLTLEIEEVEVPEFKDLTF